MIVDAHVIQAFLELAVIGVLLAISTTLRSARVWSNVHLKKRLQDGGSVWVSVMVAMSACCVFSRQRAHVRISTHERRCFHKHSLSRM